MSSRLVFKAPQCLSCWGQAMGAKDLLSFSARQQVRGKKKLASNKISSVNVQLLKNVSGYGRKGSIVPVTSGVMRNIWLPKKIAEYVTSAKLNHLGKGNTVLERDPNYRITQERPTKAASFPTIDGDASLNASQAPVQTSVRDEVQGVPSIPIDFPLLSPEQGSKILSRLLPQNIDFYRTPVFTEQPKPQLARRMSPSIPIRSAVSAAAAEAATRQAKKPEVEEQGKTSIYGSVSTNDIAANLKAILAEDENGLCIALSPENISFVGEMKHQDKVKHCGVFDIEIKLDAAVEAVRRTITIKAQE